MVEFYTIKETASKLGLSAGTVTKLVAKGRIKSVKIGKSVRIPEASLKEFEMVGKIRKPKNTFTVSEVADMFKITPQTVRKFIHSNQLKALKQGRSFYIPKNEIEKKYKVKIEDLEEEKAEPQE